MSIERNARKRATTTSAALFRIGRRDLAIKLVGMEGGKARPSRVDAGQFRASVSLPFRAIDRDTTHEA
jgi:hypothetical protein